MQNRRRWIYPVLVLVVACLAFLLTEDRVGKGGDSPLGAAPDSSGLAETALEQFAGVEQGPRNLLEPSPEEVTPDSVSHSVVLRGRCVMRDGESPLADCHVQARRETIGADAQVPWSAALPIAGRGAPSLGTAAMVTGTDGVFELLVPLESLREDVALQLSKNGYVPREARWKRPASGSVVDVGDIVMDLAIQVTGQVTHPDGEPVMDVGILFANIALTGQTKVDPQRMLRTRTDSAGRFRLEAPAFFGEWYPRVEGSGAMLEPQMVVLGEAHHPDYHIRITVEKPDPQFSITGQCVDEAGQALAGINLSADGAGFTGKSRSRIDGTFEIPRGGPARLRDKVYLSATDPEGAYEQLASSSEVGLEWGDQDVSVVLQRRPSQDVHVVDMRGQSITNFSLFAFARNGAGWIRYGNLTRHGPHPRGHVALTGLSSGTNAVLVVPTEPGLGCTDMVSFASDGSVQASPLTVTVPDQSALRVQVTASDGSAVVGSRVELLQSMQGSEPDADSAALDVGDCDLGGFYPSFLRQAQGRTDPSGWAELHTSAGSWFLRITGKTHMPHIQRVEVAQVASSLPITVQAGCSLSGTVGTESALQALVELSPNGENPVTVELSTKDTTAIAAVQADGTYSIGGLAPGSYQVALRYWMRTSTVVEGWVKAPAQSVELSPGNPQTLTIDVEPFLPGRISGQLQVDGAPLAGKHCFAKRHEPNPTMLRFSTDAQGRFEARIPPGTYSYAITLEAQPGPGWILMTLPERWSLQPGGEHKSHDNVALRKVRVQVLGVSGMPLGDQEITLSATGFHRPGNLKTNATGWVTIDPAPLSVFHLNVQVDGKKQKLGPIDLPPGQTNGDVTVRVGEGE